MSTAFLTRLKERKLVQWALTYLAGVWVLLQVLSLLSGAYGWPPIVLRAAPLLLGVGLLAVLVLAWYHGERGQQRVSGPELLMLAALLVLAGAAMAFVGRGTADPAVAAVQPDVVPPDPVVGEQSSIAVLPFLNLSSDTEQEYFSDGLTEELLNALARVPGLRVAARTSSFAFQGKAVPVDSVARALRVAHVLEGSVRRSGDRLRITAQLIDAANGYHLWSETYDRQMEDVIAIQEQIARSIVQALEVELAGGGERRLVHAQPSSSEAYDAYLRGRFFWNKRTAESIQAAITEFRNALDLDPAFALAWTGLADAYLTLQWYRMDADWAELLEQGRSAAEKALEIDPDLAQAHTALGLYWASRFDWTESDRHFRRALELDPSYPTGHYWYAHTLAIWGRHEQAAEEARIAAELDPLSLIIQRGYGLVLFWCDRYDEALVQLRKAIALDSTFVGTWQTLAYAFVELGQYQEAQDAYARWAELQGTDPEAARAAIRAVEHYATAGRPVLEPIGVEADANDAASRAGILAMTGRHEQALDLLEHELERGNPGVREAPVDPWLDPLHGNARFLALLAKMNLRPAELPNGGINR